MSPKWSPWSLCLDVMRNTEPHSASCTLSVAPCVRVEPPAWPVCTCGTGLAPAVPGQCTWELQKPVGAALPAHLHGP